MLLGQLAQHIREDEDRLGGQSGGSAHGRRIAAGAGVIGAEDESEGIDEEQSGTGHVAMIAPCAGWRAILAQGRAGAGWTGAPCKRYLYRNCRVYRNLLSAAF